MKEFRKVISILCVCLIAMGVFIIPASASNVDLPPDIFEKPIPFEDTPKTEWYYESVKYVYEEELMAGVSETIFDPNGIMTRAMLVTVLWRMEGEPTVNATNPFSDVPAGKWYTSGVVWGAANDIVKGYGNGIFDPTGKITREQIAAIMCRYAKFKGNDAKEQDNLSNYPDTNKVSSWALRDVQWAVAVGLITGATQAGNTVIAPQGNATRSQVAAIITRYENMEET